MREMYSCSLYLIILVKLPTLSFHILSAGEEQKCVKAFESWQYFVKNRILFLSSNDAQMSHHTAIFFLSASCCCQRLAVGNFASLYSRLDRMDSNSLKAIIRLGYIVKVDT